MVLAGDSDRGGLGQGTHGDGGIVSFGGGGAQGVEDHRLIERTAARFSSAATPGFVVLRGGIGAGVSFVFASVHRDHVTRGEPRALALWAEIAFGLGVGEVGIGRFCSKFCRAFLEPPVDAGPAIEVATGR